MPPKTERAPRSTKPAASSSRGAAEGKKGRSSTPNKKPAASKSTASSSGSAKTTTMPKANELGYFISIPRCRKTIKDALVPAEVAEELSQLNAELKAAREAGDAEEITNIKQQVSRLNTDSVRIGGDAPAAISAAVNYVVEDTFRTVMRSVREDSKSLVPISALHACAGKLRYWGLLSDLPVIRSYDPDYEADYKKRRSEYESAKKKHAKDKKEGLDTSAPEPLPEDADNTKGKLLTSVKSIATTLIKTEEEFQGIRVMGRVREVLAIAAAQLIHNLSLAIKQLIAGFSSVRTIKAEHVSSTLHALFVMKTGEETGQALTDLFEFMHSRVELHHKNERESKQRKEDNMSAEQRAELDAKREQKRLERLQRERDAARQRKVKAEAREKELSRALSAK